MQAELLAAKQQIPTSHWVPLHIFARVSIKPVPWSLFGEKMYLVAACVVLQQGW